MIKAIIPFLPPWPIPVFTTVFLVVKELFLCMEELSAAVGVRVEQVEFVSSQPSSKAQVGCCKVLREGWGCRNSVKLKENFLSLSLENY